MRFGLHSSSFNESLRNAWTWWSPVAVPGSKDAKAITEPGCLAIFHECVVEPLRVPAPAPLFLEVVGVEGIAGDDEDKGECKESSGGGGSWVDAYKRTKNVLGHERTRSGCVYNTCLFRRLRSVFDFRRFLAGLFSTTTYDLFHDLLLLGNSTFWLKFPRHYTLS